MCDNWKVPAAYVTVNGCAANDDNRAAAAVNGNGVSEVLDAGRVMYLQQHLIQAHRAAAEGYPLKGYFLWSLMDNRVGVGLHPALRHPPRRLRNAPSHAQTWRPLPRRRHPAATR